MQELDAQSLYTAFQDKDTRLDGRYFVGISSTGIYCRPVCSARGAKLKNSTFFMSAAEAEKAGYRPCLKCRPELAPGKSIVDAKSVLASRAAKFIEENCGYSLSFDVLAGKLGCTDRHLRRVFVDEYKVTPVQYLQTCRLLMAKRLLTDTSLSVLDIAMASGFQSLRRFNDAFKKHYRLSPTALRKHLDKGTCNDNSITLSLSYRPPYLWQEMIEFLSFRAIKGVEKVQDGTYLRTVELKTAAGTAVRGWLQIEHLSRKNAVALTVSTSLLPALQQVLARVRHLFDLTSSPDAVAELLELMNSHKPGLFIPGIRVPGCFDSFEMVVRAVLGQQITVKAAGTLAARFAENLGTPLETGIDGLAYTFPSPHNILELPGEISDHLGPLGVTSARAKTIKALALAHVDQTINFDLSAEVEAEIARLLELPGIGNWTAQYVAMRSMGWPDAFLETDFGVKKALAPLNPKEILTLAEAWRPWRAYATVSLWNSLSATITK